MNKTYSREDLRNIALEPDLVLPLLRDSVDPFPLGQRDRPDRFLIPEKLYGRDREIEKLLASFDRVIKSDYFVLFSSFRSAIDPRHELFVVARSGHGFRA